MKTFQIKYSGRFSGGHHFFILCEKGLARDAVIFLKRQKLPYLKSICDHYGSDDSFVAWIHGLAEPEELEEFRQLAEGYFTGIRVIPKHFKQGRFFIPWVENVPKASWHDP